MSPLSNATTLANYASGIGTQGATLEIQTANKRVGIGTTNPQGPAGSLQVGTAVTISGNSGIVSATTFHGDFGSSTSVAGNLSVSGVLTYEDVTNIDSVGIITARKNIVLPDSSDSSDGRIKFGASSDMMLYHYGGANYIDVANTLNIRGGGGSAINIKPKNDEEGIKIIPNGAIELYYDNSKKFETTSGGISVTGAGTFTGNLTVNNQAQIYRTAAVGGSTSGNTLLMLKSDVGGTAVAKAFIDTDGAASFAGGDLTINSSGNLLSQRSGSTGFVDLNSTGILKVRGAASGSVFTIENSSTNAATVSVLGNGSATFAGTIDVNSNSLLQDGARIVPNGVIQVRKDAAGLNRCIEVYKGGNALSNITANINNDGSATFAGDVTFGGNLELGDNNRIRLGAGDDLQIYHNGSHSFIDEAGQGNLLIRANATTHIQKYTGESSASFHADGAVELYYDNSKKFETTSAGIKVSGSFPDIIIHDTDTTNDNFRILHNGGGTQLLVDPNNVGPNASHFIVGIDGSERLRIDSSGRVGIGELSPAANLEITPGTGAGTLLLNYASGSTTDGALNIEVGTGGVLYETRKTGGLAHIWYATGAERMRIDSSGRLLVGTTAQSLTAKFVIQGQTDGANVGGYMRIQTGTSVTADHALGTISFGDASHNGANIQARGDMSWSPFGKGSNLRFSTTGQSQTEPQERMRIDSYGRLLLGTTTPGPTAGEHLTIADSANAGITIRSGTNAAGSILFEDDTADRGEIQYSHNGDYIRFKTAGSEQMRIDSSGRLLINGGTDVRIELGTTGTTGTNNRNHIRADGANLKFNTASGGRHIFEQNGTEKMRLRDNGRFSVIQTATDGHNFVTTQSSASNINLMVGVHSATTLDNGTAAFVILTNGTYSALSDETHKKNIVTARDGYLDDLNKLRVVKYNWKEQDDTESKELGLIAQEVEQVFSGLVHETKIGDEETGSSSSKGIKVSVLNYMLLKALQEASAKIETLESKVAALEG